MTTSEARELLDDIRRHVAGALRYAGRHEQGELPDDLDPVDAMAAELSAIGRLADQLERAMS